jgi:hypothetical protein
MTSRQRQIARLGFGLASVLLFLGALVPMAKGLPPIAAFLGAGVVFAILGSVVGKQSDPSGGPPAP